MIAARPNECRLQLGLFIGLMLIFLAVWKGDGGYRDLGEYLNNSENLWLKGDLSKPGEPGKYYIHPLGIAVLSGPFVYAGALIEKISGGSISERSVTALSIPIFSVLACVLVYKIGRELQFTSIVSVWAALILAIGSPMLSFTRLYFGEGGTALSITLAIWAFLRARRSDGSAFSWAMLAGAGLAGATACHFNNLWISMWLWIGMAAAFATDKASSQRAMKIAAMTLIPVLAGGALLYMNARRFGGPFMTGYENQLNAESTHPVSLLNAPKNIEFLGLWLLRVPWTIPAFAYLFKLLPRERGLALGIAAAAMSHVIFFQMYTGLHIFPIRYEESVVILLAIGLLVLGDALWRSWGARGVGYIGLIVVLWNTGNFIRSTDSTSTQSFFASPDDGKLNCYVWYMEPLTRAGFGTPMGPLQWAMLAILLAAGCAVLALAIRAAYRLNAAPVSA